MNRVRLIAMLFLVCALGCTRPARTENLILIVIDTLRADHLGAYGYPLDTSPSLDRLAREGVLFADAVAQAPWTRPSVATMLTGLYPPTHGVTCKHFNRPEADCDVLPESVSTLAELLSRRGLATAGIVANIQVDETFGFAQGFDSYRNVFDDLAASDSTWREHWHEFKWVNHTTEAVTRAASRFLEKQSSRRPFFLYLHYLDPHEPYAPPAPYDTMFSAEHYDSPQQPIREDLALYDGEIRMVDDAIGRLRRVLEQASLDGSTGIIVTSDHGEAFGEHGPLDRRHGLTLYEDQLRVPLVAMLPGVTSAATRVNAPVRLLDLASTVLDLFGLEAPSAMQGRSLLPALRGRPLAPRGSLAGWGYNPLVAYRDPPWKLIRDERSGRVELYDVQNDAGERRELSVEQPQLRMLLATQLDEQLDAARRAARGFPRASGAVPLDEDKARGLRALGYVD